MTPTNPRKRKKAPGSSRVLKPPFYVISDTHWYHKNIIKYCNRPARHNENMTARWNAKVWHTDTVLHLGDVFMSRSPEDWEVFFTIIAPSLYGKKFVIAGNHDEPKALTALRKAGWTVIKPFTMRYRGFDVSFDHYPTKRGAITPGDQTIRVHGHLHNNGYNSPFEKRREMKRYGNINASVEMIDYTPQPVTALLDKTIKKMKSANGYVNVPQRLPRAA